MIFEKASFELKHKRDDYKEENRKRISYLSKKMGKKFMNKAYDYLNSIDNQSMPQLFMNNHK